MKAHGKVALGSQGALRRATRLFYETPRSWIAKCLQECRMAGPRNLMWVKGYSRVAGNEVADRNANLAVYSGSPVGASPNKVTPAGIRQEYLIHHKHPLFNWSRKAIKGSTHTATELRSWLRLIGWGIRLISWCKEVPGFLIIT